MFLFELYVVSMYLLKKEDKFSGVQKQLLERLLDLRSVLSEAQEILGYEAPSTIEGARAKTAGEYRVRLDDMIRHLEEKIKTSGSSSDDRPHGNGFKEEKE